MNSILKPRSFLLKYISIHVFEKLYNNGTVKIFYMTTASDMNQFKKPLKVPVSSNGFYETWN